LSSNLAILPELLLLHRHRVTDVNRNGGGVIDYLTPVCDPFIKDSDGFVASAAASIATGWNDQLPGGYHSR
jgi:hypothetical protein